MASGSDGITILAGDITTRFLILTGILIGVEAGMEVLAGTEVSVGIQSGVLLTVADSTVAVFTTIRSLSETVITLSTTADA